ncbi:MAG: flagellar basal body protein [Candidatus Nanopelagicales bacterium]
MSIFATDGVAMTLHSALDGLSLRQRVIADNIANVDTPGFRARSVEFEDSLRAALGAGTLTSGAPAATTSTTSDPAGINGNNVDLGAQTMAQLQSVFQYQLLARASGDRYEMLRVAGGAF